MLTRTIPQRWIRPAVASASGFVVGLSLMGWLHTNSNLDLPSYGAGYAWVATRSAGAAQGGTDALSACQQYVSAGTHLANDQSGIDFLMGCKAAYRKK